MGKLKSSDQQSLAVLKYTIVKNTAIDCSCLAQSISSDREACKEKVDDMFSWRSVWTREREKTCACNGKGNEELNK